MLLNFGLVGGRYLFHTRQAPPKRVTGFRRRGLDSAPNVTLLLLLRGISLPETTDPAGLDGDKYSSITLTISVPLSRFLFLCLPLMCISFSSGFLLYGMACLGTYASVTIKKIKHTYETNLLDDTYDPEYMHMSNVVCVTRFEFAAPSNSPPQLSCVCGLSLPCAQNDPTVLSSISFPKNVDAVQKNVDAFLAVLHELVFSERLYSRHLLVSPV